MLFARMLRAARFDPSLYEELRRDPISYAQAITVLFMAFAALIVGRLLFLIFSGGTFGGFAPALLGPFALWALPAMSLYLLGGLVKATDPDLGNDRDLVVAIGFAASPGILWAMPHPLVVIIIWGWVFAAMLTAAKAMLRINFARAVLFMVPGLLMYLVLVTVLAILASRGAAA